MKTQEIFDQIVKHLPSFEVLIKTTMEWEYLSITPDMLISQCWTNILPEDLIVIDFNKVESDYPHQLVIFFCTDGLDFNNETYKEIEFMGNTLYITYHNEMLEALNKTK